MPTDTVSQVALGIEALIALAGLWTAWTFHFSLKARARPLASVLRPWDAGVADIGLLVWVVLCGGLVLQMLGMAVTKHLGLSPEKAQVAAGAFFQFGMLAACLGFIFTTRAGKDYDVPRKGLLLPGLLCFCVAVPTVFFVGFLWQSLLVKTGIPFKEQDLIGLFRETKDAPWLLFMGVLAVIVAPLSEELIFRAGIFRFLRTRPGVPRWTAYAVSALLFGVLHLSTASFPQLVVLGLLFAYAYERTGNIGVPMLAHALFNGNTVILILAGVKF